jgi:hypothetical protein
MGRPHADLASYSPWGAVPIPPPHAPPAFWLPTISAAGLQTFGDLAIWALFRPSVFPIVQLYTNFYTPTTTSVIADFTSAAAPGLYAQPLPAAVYKGIDANGRADWEFPGLVFTAGGSALPVMVQGYWVQCSDPVTGVPGFLWAQQFPAPFAFLTGGDSLPVPLALSIGQC